MIIVADTSGLLAAFDSDQEEHDAALPIMSERLLVSPLVLTELDHLIRRNHGFDAGMRAAKAMTDRISAGRYRLASLSNDDFMTAATVRATYASLELDLADAVGVVLAHRFATNEIFTLDQRDFRAITPLSSAFDHFRILPADG